MRIELFLDKSVEENASIYFEKSKKLKKKVKGAKEALIIHKKKLEKLEKEKKKEIETYEKNKVIKTKKEWYFGCY